MGIAIFAIATSAIHNALRADLAARRSRFATLRSLGARPHDIAGSIIWQLGLITGVAILIAALLTAILGAAVGPMLGHTLGFAFQPDFTDGPMIAAFVFGFVALVAMKPVRNACLTSPACLFRHQTANQAIPRSNKLNLLKTVLAIALLGIAGALIDLGWFGFMLLGLLIACQGLFVLLGRVIRALAGKLATKHMLVPSLRLALRNIARPSAPTVTITASFGLAMTCLCAVLLFGSLAGQHLKSVLPSQTPDVVFFDIPPAEQSAFLSNVTSNDAVVAVTQMPFLHGRVTHLNGMPLTRGDVPRRYHWFLRGDRGMSWADRPTADMRQNPVTAGEWWRADSLNQRLLSLDAGVAQAIGIVVGDRLTLNIMGQPFEGKVANLRQIDWTRLGLDFPIVLSPMEPVFDHGVISALNLQDGTHAKTAIDATLNAYPNVPVVFVKEVLAKLNRLFDGVTAALIGLTMLATLGSVLVIVCGLIALRQQQTEALAMLRALGLRPNQINKTGALETGLMVATGGLVGVIAGSTIAVGAANAIGSINPSQIADVAGPMTAIIFGLVLVCGFAGGWMLQASSLRAQAGWRG
nr:FtsX-like permease family protein [Thalassospira sp. HF15]